MKLSLIEYQKLSLENKYNYLLETRSYLPILTINKLFVLLEDETQKDEAIEWLKENNKEYK